VKLTKPIYSSLSYIKKLFLSGLFMILPIVLTMVSISFTYAFIAKWLTPLRKIIPLYFQRIPGSEFILVTVAILLIGFLLKLVFITPIVHWFENLIVKIPLIRSVYSSSKTLVNFFNVSPAVSKKRKVILIEFPRKGFFNIAFLLEPATDNFQKIIPADKLDNKKTYYKVFLPNSPNPTSGYFLILPENEIIYTNLTFDEAIKSVVSCGLITPASIEKL